jgi:hypothetical protein
MRTVSEIVYVENLDSSELVEEHIMSIKSENNDENFDEESCTIDDDDLNSKTETEGNSKVNDLQRPKAKRCKNTKTESSLATIGI